MEERKKLKKEILDLIKKEVERLRLKHGLIVDKIDIVALIDLHNKVEKL
jgi:hypothetical protein